MVKKTGKMIQSRDGKVTKIEVKNPILHSCFGGKFVDFEIEIETTSIAFCRKYSSIRRRYSEFIWLRNRLAHSEIIGLSGRLQVPVLPPKRLFGRFEPSFLRSRQQGLKDFLEEVLKVNYFLSFSGLHLFLQSDLTMEEIQNFLEGKFGDYLSVDSILESRETNQDGGVVKRTSASVVTHENCKHVLVGNNDFMMVNSSDCDLDKALATEDGQSLDGSGSGLSTCSVDSHDYRAFISYK